MSDFHIYSFIILLIPFIAPLFPVLFFQTYREIRFPGQEGAHKIQYDSHIIFKSVILKFTVEHNQCSTTRLHWLQIYCLKLVTKPLHTDYSKIRIVYSNIAPHNFRVRPLLAPLLALSF